jgi:hypothetical protein
MDTLLSIMLNMLTFASLDHLISINYYYSTNIRYWQHFNHKIVSFRLGCGDATTRLQTGDRIRLDGACSTVEILETRAPLHF